MREWAVRAFLVAAFVGLMLHAAMAPAQELEPRAYSSSPVGTNFIGASYTYLTGDVLTDPSLPVTNVEAHIGTTALAYVHTFGLAGHGASIGIVLPVVSGDLTGTVIDAPTEIHRGGMGDARFRFAYSVFGNPALTPGEFAHTPPSTSLGVSLTVSAPTGVYDASRLVNVGTNRWSFKPEIGLSHPWGRWFLEASAGAWFFTDNHDFYGGKDRSQDPIFTAQLYGGYTFRPGMWLAGAVGYAEGGQTTVNGVTDRNRQSNARYGLTFSAPFARGWSTKVAISNGLVTRIGGDYKSISVAVQYRWFDK
ncbi:transporter [Dyella amyloliquefaciens]|uniref:transporter n=1 Tax=Dyella amyloliquefaciens TaxID=1770545 RepID=UPI00197AB5A6|nr:transporter [Dyella amyloliquefaciens]